MASLAMTASFLGSSATTRRGVVMAKAGIKMPESVKVESCSKRRDLVFAVAATAACTIAEIAMADEEPKRGTEEAKKKYAAICVSMPTARVCHK